MLMKKNEISTEQLEKWPDTIIDWTGSYMLVKSWETSGPHGHRNNTIACSSVLKGGFQLVGNKTCCMLFWAAHSFPCTFYIVLMSFWKCQQQEGNEQGWMVWRQVMGYMNEKVQCWWRNLNVYVQISPLLAPETAWLCWGVGWLSSGN